MDNGRFSVVTSNVGCMYSVKHRNMLEGRQPGRGERYAKRYGYGATPAEALDPLASLLDHLQPTVICLQEVRKGRFYDQDRGQMELLEAMIGQSYEVFYGGGTNPGPTGMEHRAMLIHQQRTNGTPAEQLTGPDKYPLGLAYKLTSVGSPDQWIACVHLPYSDVQNRLQQLQYLICWGRRKAEEGSTVLLAGDFQTHHTFTFSRAKKEAAYATYAALQEQGYDHLSANVRSTWNYPDLPGKLGLWLGRIAGIRLDHFWGIGIRTVTKPRTHSSHLRGKMDHLLLHGEFEPIR